MTFVFSDVLLISTKLPWNKYATTWISAIYFSQVFASDIDSSNYAKKEV